MNDYHSVTELLTELTYERHSMKKFGLEYILSFINNNKTYYCLAITSNCVSLMIQGT